MKNPLGSTSPREQGISFPPLSNRPQYGRFGRFGRFHDDGLLTVDVNPRGFSYPSCLPPFRVLWGEASAPLTAVVPKIDPTEKQLSIQGGGEGAPRLIRYSLLFPGVAAWFGRRMVLHFVGKGNQPQRCAIDPSRVKRGEGILIVPGDRFPSSPLLVIPPPQANLRVWYDGANLTVEGADDLGEVRFITLAGLGTLDSLRSAWDRAGQLRDLAVPVRTRSRSVVDPPARMVLVSETFDGTVAPLSPLLAHAIDNGFPANVSGRLVRSGILTRWGEYVWVEGNRAEVQLPLPPMTGQALFRPATIEPALLRQRDALIALDPGEKSDVGVRDSLEAMLALQKSIAFLPQSLAETLPRRWTDVWKRVLAKENAQVVTEPITGHSYSGLGGSKGDREALTGVGGGAARVVSALGEYVRLTGDWTLAREQFAWVARSRRFSELSEDWVWMAPADSDHGGGTGDAAMLATVYAAAQGERFLAAGLGDESAQVRATIRMAKLAVGLVARLTIGTYAVRTRQLPPGSLVYGYHETDGYLGVGSVTGDPALVAGLLGDVFSADALSTLYGELSRDDFRKWLEVLAVARPRWFDPRALADPAKSSAGNSLRTAWPHFLHRIRVAGESTGMLAPRWDIAMGNRRGGLVALPVLAEFASRKNPVVLTEWGKAGFVDGALDSDGEGVSLRFRSTQQQTVVVVVECRPGFRPEFADRDGVPVAIRWTQGRGEIRLNAPAGNWNLRLRRSEPGHATGPTLSPGPAPKPLMPSGSDLAPR